MRNFVLVVAFSVGLCCTSVLPLESQSPNECVEQIKKIVEDLDQSEKTNFFRGLSFN